MPEGVVTTVEDGFATIDFVDRKQRGPGLSRLIALYGPEVIETLTRQGPRRLYRVPEGNAREAGLLDGPGGEVEEIVVVHEVPQTYDDGKPDADWTRPALDEYAARIGLNPREYPNKGAILKAIRAAEK